MGGYYGITVAARPSDTRFARREPANDNRVLPALAGINHRH